MNILNTHNIAGKYLGRLSTGKTNKYKLNILRIKDINHTESPPLHYKSLQGKSVYLQGKSVYRKLQYKSKHGYMLSSLKHKFVFRKGTL